MTLLTPPRSRVPDPRGANRRLPALRDIAGRDALAELHRPLALRLVRDTLGEDHPEYHDAVQDALVGLLRACETFDESRGFAFSTHACPHIRACLHRGLRARGRFRPGAEPSLGWAGPGRFGLRFRGDRRRPAGVGDGRLPGEVLGDVAGVRAPGPAEACEAADDVRGLAGWLDRLAAERPRLVAALAHHYGIGTEPKTLEAIGAIFGVTKERVRQLVLEAIWRLKGIAGAERPESWRERESRARTAGDV